MTVINQPPIAQAGSATVLSDGTTSTIKLNATDPENDPLAFSQVGTLKATNGRDGGKITNFDPSTGVVVYQAPLSCIELCNPDKEATIDFKVSDGQLDSKPATVTITINTPPPPPPPVAENQTVTVYGNPFGANPSSSFPIQLKGSDPLNQKISYIKASDPSAGTLSFNNNGQNFNSDGSVIYTPTPCPPQSSNLAGSIIKKSGSYVHPSITQVATGGTAPSCPTKDSFTYRVNANRGSYESQARSPL